MSEKHWKARCAEFQARLDEAVKDITVAQAQTNLFREKAIRAQQALDGIRRFMEVYQNAGS